jgi:hypothetical protein
MRLCLTTSFLCCRQFSEFIQPELSEHAADILPVLLQYLDTAFAQLTPGAKVRGEE